ncbi:MAG TPA: hypothetical protein DEV87_05070 [Clostridiales bacterium]|nr:hypothetical protein [Clostridiales bacterium]
MPSLCGISTAYFFAAVYGAPPRLAGVKAPLCLAVFTRRYAVLFSTAAPIGLCDFLRSRVTGYDFMFLQTPHGF